MKRTTDGNFAYGEYTHTLRLKSELFELRVGYVHPIRAQAFVQTRCGCREIAEFFRAVRSASGVRFRVITNNKRDTARVSLVLLVEMTGIEPVSKDRFIQLSP